ncbi:MAG: signal recognition particle-docking protein FtsY [Deltaproteobacteria bacterium]|nr:signal recognition particle-docking protein FtsY [Deltaproteobacteria bacterium]
MEGSSFFQRLKKGLAKTRDGWIRKLEGVLQGEQWGEQTIEAMEEILIGADVGVQATEKLIQKIREGSPKDEWGVPMGPSLYLQKLLLDMLKSPQTKDERPRLSEIPWIVLFLGVNGVGKTTTIGKMAAAYRAEGKKVSLVAADTFRAGAIEQLEAWGNKAGVEVIKHRAGADPSAVVFDALHAAKKRGTDLVLIDTAGRLHTKIHLVEELKKIRRIAAREQPGSPHETLLVLDATTGQNGFLQAKVFKEAVDITGIILTKLDGTAKGGIVIAIQEELGIPVQYIGVGEEVEDLQPFDPARFVQALFDRN